MQFNEQLTPNWTGHFLLSVLLLITSPSWAEKLVLITYLAGLPLGLRFLFGAANLQNKLLIYLVFPFIYSFLFHYGFYNFNIGIVLFFFGLGVCIKSIDKPSFTGIIGLTLIASLISLSHPFVFVLFLLTVLLFNQQNIVDIFLTRNQERKANLKQILQQIVMLVPGLIITVMFLLTDESLKSETTSLDWKDLLVSLKYLMPIKGIEAEAYNLVSRLMLYMFSALILSSIIRSAYDWVTIKSWNWKAWKWLSAALLFLVLLFFVPDYLGTAGFVSGRLMWFFFIVLILWFSSVRLPKWLVLVSFVLANGITFWSIQHNHQAVSKSAKIASELAEASNVIEPYSTVLPITYRKSKPFVHVSNYIAVRKPMILLHNYEAALSYFPLLWRYENITPQLVGEMETTGCVSWIGGKSHQPPVRVDYVCVVKETGARNILGCETELSRNLAAYYELVYSNPDRTVMLYRSLEDNPRVNG